MPRLNQFNKSLGFIFLLFAVAACDPARVKPGGETVEPNIPDINLPAFKERAVPEEAASDWELAKGFMQERSWARARQAMSSLHKRYPEFSGPLLSLALIHWQTDQKDKARPLVEEAIKRHPRNAAAYNLLGAVERRDGQFDKAKQAYENALAANPDFGPALLNLGILNDLYLGNKQAALSLYEKFQSLQDEEDNQVRLWIADLNRQLK